MSHEHEHAPQRSAQSANVAKRAAERPTSEGMTTSNSARVQMLRARGAGAVEAPPVHLLPGPLAVAGPAPSDGPEAMRAGSVVQCKIVTGGHSPADLHQAAREGIASGGGRLPHFEAIQHAFGLEHDLSSVKAHLGAEAARANEKMGAEAFATGNHVAFRAPPSLGVAAHEAAHVVQQRGGVQLKGGVGEAGDPYERHADEVADRVVHGQSAGPLLDRMAGASGASLHASGGSARGVQFTLEDAFKRLGRFSHVGEGALTVANMVGAGFQVPERRAEHRALSNRLKEWQGAGEKDPTGYGKRGGADVDALNRIFGLNTPEDAQKHREALTHAYEKLRGSEADVAKDLLKLLEHAGDYEATFKTDLVETKKKVDLKLIVAPGIPGQFLSPFEMGMSVESCLAAKDPLPAVLMWNPEEEFKYYVTKHANEMEEKYAGDMAEQDKGRRGTLETLDPWVVLAHELGHLKDFLEKPVEFAEKVSTNQSSEIEKWNLPREREIVEKDLHKTPRSFYQDFVGGNNERLLLNLAPLIELAYNMVNRRKKKKPTVREVRAAVDKKIENKSQSDHIWERLLALEPNLAKALEKLQEA